MFWQVYAKLFTPNSYSLRQDKSYCDPEINTPSSFHYTSSSIKIPSHWNTALMVQGDVMNIN